MTWSPGNSDSTRPRRPVPMRIVLALCTTLFAACESNDLGLNALAPARVAVTVPLGDSSLNQALGLDNLHLTLRHASGSAALDSTIPIRAGADSVAVDFSVVLRPTASARPLCLNPRTLMQNPSSNKAISAIGAR